MRYIRLATGWGQEGNGGLYDEKQVNGTTIDFSRIDQIVDELNTLGIQTQFVSSVPDGYKVDASDHDNWQQLYQNFSKHWFGKTSNPSYEILSNIKDLYFPYNQSTDNYPNIDNYVDVFRAAADGILTGGASETINPLIYAGSVKGEYAYITGGDQDGLRNRLKSDHGTSRCDGLSAELTGYDAFHHACFDGGGFREQGQDWTFTWESILSDYRSADATDASSVDYTSVPDFLKIANEALDYSDITKAYISQLIDGNDGTKGLISADGTKSALYYGLKLYNEMPLDRSTVTIQNAGSLKGLASEDENRAALVVWNEGSEQTATLSLRNIPFSSGSVKIYTIDKDHSNNGTLSEETAALDGNRFSKSVTIPANGTVYIIADNGSPVTQYAPITGIKADHGNWWFKYTESWAWHGFDAKSSTLYVGDRSYVTVNNGSNTGDFGVSSEAIDLEKPGDKILVKARLQGKPTRMDNNSALYLRIDYEEGFEEDGVFYGYFGSPTIYVDDNNGVYDPTHGSQPDSYPSGNVKEENVEHVNFADPNGFVIDLTKYAPSDWDGNIRIISYIQNSGLHGQGGGQYKFQLLNPNQVVNGISAIKNVNDGDVKSLEIYDTAGRMVKNINGAALNLQNVPKGVYIIKENTTNGSNTRKIIKR